MHKQVAVAIQAMLNVIEQHQFEAIRRYPKDIEIDKDVLLRKACPGAEFIWKVGHCGTHLIQLNIHPEEQSLCGCSGIVNASASDRFYRLKFHPATGQLSFQEVSREHVKALSNAKVPYSGISSNRGDSLAVWKNQVLIGHLSLEFQGRRPADHIPLYLVTIRPYDGISQLDKIALSRWAHKQVASAAGSLWAPVNIQWADPIPVPLVA